MPLRIASLSYTRAAALGPGKAGYAQASAAVTPFQVFDRKLKIKQRDWAASNKERSRLTDYLKEDAAEGMAERLLDIKRRYATILDLGSGPGYFLKHLDASTTQEVILADSSEKMLYRDADREYKFNVTRILCDEERLPFEPNSQEAILSCLSMHWINDLPGTLQQIESILKPDGVFMGAMLGGDTLFELRTSLQLAQQEREGGISPHVSPMIRTQDVTNLMNRAKFVMTTVDLDEMQIGYPSIFELIDDLRWMGESNSVLDRRPYLHRDTLIAANEIYKELYGTPEGHLPATFQVVHMIGWKAHHSQPKPAARGSGTINLKDALGDDEKN